jgi:hypothetical protein
MRVYFIQCGAGGPVKIGMSSDTASRLSQLQVANPVELHLLADFHGWALEERALHQLFAGKRVRGEWFDGEAVRAILPELRANKHRILDFVAERVAERKAEMDARLTAGYERAMLLVADLTLELALRGKENGRARVSVLPLSSAGKRA